MVGEQSLVASTRRRWWLPSALSTSLVLHGGLLASGAWLLTRGVEPAPPATQAVELSVELEPGPVELPVVSGLGDPRGSVRSLPDDEPRAQGGAKHPRVADPRAGKGGDATSAPAVNLSDSDDEVSLTVATFNHLERSQVQRLDTSDKRRSWDDRRATPNPMQLSFVVTGPGTRAERRTPSRYDPSTGDRLGAQPTEAGGALGSNVDPYGNDIARGGEQAGAKQAEAAAGVQSGHRRSDYRLSAAVQVARPAVPRARAAVPARVPGSPSDTQDSDQEVSAAVRSLIQASTAGGPIGAGAGGEKGPGARGSGAESGPGSRSSRAGNGGAYAGGPPLGQTSYFLDLERKVEWQHAFPDWAIAEGRSGVAIVTFGLGPKGELTSIQVSRRSGVPEFDRNVLRAVQRAAPFGAPPSGLRRPIVVRMSFDALNPVVGRDGPGRGGKPKTR